MYETALKKCNVYVRHGFCYRLYIQSPNFFLCDHKTLLKSQSTLNGCYSSVESKVMQKPAKGKDFLLYLLKQLDID